MNTIAKVQAAMLAYNAGDTRRINHLLKVYALAKAIGELEMLQPDTQYILELAALTHDIGIRNSQQKYGSAAGEYQQLEGPPEARRLLLDAAVSEPVVDRVCWLIAHHHTYRDIQGQDYQILIEADFLVNIDEDGLHASSIRKIEQTLFQTSAGKRFLHAMFPSAAG